MERDAGRMRRPSFAFAQVMNGISVEEIVTDLLAARASAANYAR